MTLLKRMNQLYKLEETHFFEIKEQIQYKDEITLKKRVYKLREGWILGLCMIGYNFSIIMNSCNYTKPFPLPTCHVECS